MVKMGWEKSSPESEREKNINSFTKVAAKYLVPCMEKKLNCLNLDTGGREVFRKLSNQRSSFIT